jgi:hypothetical protein
MRPSTDASTCFFAGIALWVLHSALNKQTLITFPKGLHVKLAIKFDCMKHVVNL